MTIIGGKKTATHSRDETYQFGFDFASGLKSRTIIALIGPLGAGKTTLAQGLGAGLGIEEPITSPAFNYLFEYSGRLPFYHADLYRIENASQFLSLGFDEYFDREGVFVIEWAERIADILPPETIRIYLNPVDDEDTREIIICKGAQSKDD
jgi:tRNA threonylcarbamoyladenosine biosynthesis protein TsaE